MSPEIFGNLWREKKVIEEEFSYLQEVNSNQTEKLSELTESLAELSQRTGSNSCWLKW